MADNRLHRLASLAFGAAAGIAATLHVRAEMNEVCRLEVGAWRRAVTEGDAAAAASLQDRVDECTHGATRDVRLGPSAPRAPPS